MTHTVHLSLTAFMTGNFALVRPEMQQDENTAVVKKAVEAEHRAHLLAEELDAVRQELADVKMYLMHVKVAKADASDASEDDRTITDSPSAAFQCGSEETYIRRVVENVKSLEELMERVCERSCTQNNGGPNFTQIYSYFHQLQVRLQSGRLRSTQSNKDSVDNVDAFVNWAKV